MTLVATATGECISHLARVLLESESRGVFPPRAPECSPSSLLWVQMQGAGSRKTSPSQALHHLEEPEPQWGTGPAQRQQQEPGLEAHHCPPPHQTWGGPGEALPPIGGEAHPPPLGSAAGGWQGARIPERLVRTVTVWQYCSSCAHGTWSLGAWLGPAA